MNDRFREDTWLRLQLDRTKDVDFGLSAELEARRSQLKPERRDQVERIVIRDVVGARSDALSKLRDVDEVIDAPHVVHGRSQFD